LIFLWKAGSNAFLQNPIHVHAKALGRACSTYASSIIDLVSLSNVGMYLDTGVLMMTPTMRSSELSC
jgi:hypothetical protein